MSTQFALDLRLARRKAGFTQRDIACLLAVRETTVCGLERGRRAPSLAHIVTLSLIYGRSFESLFAHEMKQAEAHLRRRIVKLPKHKRPRALTHNRSTSVDRLARRLADSETGYGRA